MTVYFLPKVQTIQTVRSCLSHLVALYIIMKVAFVVDIIARVESRFRKMILYTIATNCGSSVTPTIQI